MVCGALGATSGCAGNAAGSIGRSSPVSVGYIAGWATGATGERITALPGAEGLTHVIYAFAAVSPGGGVTLAEPLDSVNLARLRSLKARHPGLSVLVAIGGWTGSGRFSDIAASAESRERFARSVVDVIIRPHAQWIDGIDIDWEYPVGGGLPANATRPEDRENFTLLLAELRRQLDDARVDRRYLLTAATSAGPRAVTDLELLRISQIVDWLNVMTYDYHTGGTRAHFNAPLYASAEDPTPGQTVDATVQRYLEAGVPPERIVMGIPFYGVAYRPATVAGEGRFQPADSAQPEGQLAYRSIARRLADGERLTRHWDGDARVPWLFDRQTRLWITFDDAASVGEKAAYAREKGLRGVMAWELMSDDGTLTRAMVGAVRGN